MSKKLTRISDDLNKFTQQLFGPMAGEIGQTIGDRARLWRVKNLLSIQQKLERICQQKGLDPRAGRHLALSAGLPLLEKASCQDDEYLQERWAHLIARSMHIDNHSGTDFSLDITYIEILNQFSRLDCEVLEFIVENGIKSRDKDTGIMQVSGLDPDKVIAAYPNTVPHISLEKLESLGCVSRRPKTPLIVGNTGIMEYIAPTVIGINLYVSASGKMPSWNERTTHVQN